MRGALQLLCVVLMLACGCAHRSVEGTMLYGSWFLLYRFPDVATCRRALGQAAEKIQAGGENVYWSCDEIGDSP